MVTGEEAARVDTSLDPKEAGIVRAPEGLGPVRLVL